MKRDPDYIRQILTEFERSELNCFKEHLATCDGPLFKGIETENGRANQVRAEHIRWMIDEGLLARVGEKSPYVRVTAAGCDFLNTFSDEGLWEKTKDGAKVVWGYDTWNDA